MSIIRWLWLCGAILWALAVWCAAVANAQSAYTAYPPSPPVGAPPAPAPALAQDQIQQLVAPIALYPDPLIAQILPAATYPQDVASAAQWVVANPNAPESAIDAQPWDPAVKALCHYPTVLQRMAADLNWTQALGSAFLNQQGDVMTAVQALRTQAQNANVLYSTPQQQVVDTNGDIEIEPTDPNILYVPTYAPLYSNGFWTFGPAIDFGIGFPCGFWLDSDCDWGHGYISVGVGWDHGWRARWVQQHGYPTAPGRPDFRGRSQGPHPWAHDNARPGPILPPAYRRSGPGLEAPAVREYRGFGGVSNFSPRGRAVTPPVERPGYGAFGPGRTAPQVERYSNRGRQSLAPAPAPRAAPPERPMAARPPEVERPAPPVPAARPEQPSVFHESAPGRTVEAQSARGNASRNHR